MDLSTSQLPWRHSRHQFRVRRLLAPMNREFVSVRVSPGRHVAGRHFQWANNNLHVVLAQSRDGGVEVLDQAPAVSARIPGTILWLSHLLSPQCQEKSLLRFPFALSHSVYLLFLHARR